MLQASWLKSKALAVGWFMMMNVLFVLPGSSLPKNNWFSLLHIDKWVHTCFFLVLVFLWYSSFNGNLSKKIWTIVVLSITYGILVEIVQGLWIPSRSFDVYDILADTAGSFLGWIIWLRVNKK
jgi:VanZ family protein